MDKIQYENEIEALIDLAMFAGKIMLENGAETYRVEETITRICYSRDIQNVETFVIPTGIFVTCHYEGKLYSYIKRIKEFTIDLHMIDLVNEFSRRFVTSTESIKEARRALEVISNSPTFHPLVRWVFAGLAGGFFSLLFGSGIIEFILAFITSAFTIGLIDQFDKLGQSFFLKNILGGMCTMGGALLLSSILSKFSLDAQVDLIVIGSIMPLVPGVAFTNAVRDSINGDFVSGASKLLEVVVIAFGIAFGVGIVLNFHLLFQGGM